MKALKRIAAILMVCLIITVVIPTEPFNLTFTVEAHSGRTDRYGGHKDNKNKSGLGNYHYHCGGYPAHLHENGVCPYAGTTNATNTTNNSVASNKNGNNNSQFTTTTNNFINKIV